MIDFNEILKTRGITKIEPRASINGVEIDFDNTPDRSITVEQYINIRANTPGFEKLYAKLNDEALIRSVNNCLSNLSNHSIDSYDHVLASKLVPELIKRLDIRAAAEFELSGYVKSTPVNDGEYGVISELTFDGESIIELFEQYENKKITVIIKEV